MNRANRDIYAEHFQKEDSYAVDYQPTTFELSLLAANLSSGNINISPDVADQMVTSAYEIWKSARAELVAQIGKQNQLSESGITDTDETAATGPKGKRYGEFDDFGLGMGFLQGSGSQRLINWRDSLKRFTGYNPPGKERVLVGCIEDLVKESPEEWQNLNVASLRQNGLPEELLKACGARAEKVAAAIISTDATERGRRSGEVRKNKGKV